ncbi:hypothetical protein QEJ31_00510 [Pigmentibacter sp. JX0631]|uniref:hypothetical protein n=1 Tax=Pigmentibacter sp. JX0631 TaxID=2976982 RepID=UPI0024696FB6|nr:hypothetical protein [Pigmentibacter sp. JX0631]WGL60084.1 hypothetical protein QEJ31_00510 [Pigmentibacter sp. JX0631]
MPFIFTAAQRRSLDRISGNYLNFLDEESDFTISDIFSLGLLLTQATLAKDRNKQLIDYYKSAYSITCGALHIKNPELFLIRVAGKDKVESWNDFSDFKAVWYPKWFSNQLELRKSIFLFTNEELQKSTPDFWGETCSDDLVKNELLAVKSSFQQIHIGVLAVVLKIDFALAALLNWPSHVQIPWKNLQENYHFPSYPGLS